MFGKSRLQAAAIMAMAMAATAPFTKRGSSIISFDESAMIATRQPRFSKDWREASNNRENQRRKRQIKAGWHPVVYSAENHNQRV